MTAPLGVNEFFVLEAGEYLDRLGALVAGADPPPIEELLRATRALRGSALMASQAPIARAAAGLEVLARALRDGRRTWDQEVRRTTADAVAELRTYLGRLAKWSDADTGATEALARQLEAAAGIAPRPVAAPVAAGVADAGTRAFVAREGAAVASALDQAGRILRAGPGAREALQAAMQRTQPLRGLAALADYPPLAEILDAVELTATDVERGDLDPHGAAELIDASARAMNRAARDVIGAGRPDPEADEVRRLADLLTRARSSLPAIVSIEALFPEDGEPGIVERGNASSPGRGEIVSRGERLRQVADDLERTASTTQRELRLHAIALDLRSLASGIAGDLGHRLHLFGAGALESIAGQRSADLGTHLRRAGDLLLEWRDEDPVTSILTTLAEMTHRLTQSTAAPASVELSIPVQPAAPAPPAPAPPSPDDALPIVPIESLLFEEAAPARISVPSLELTAEQPVVPIEALAPEPEAAAPMAVAEEPGDLAGSFATYHRLVATLGRPPVASLEVLMAGTRIEPARRPTPAPAPVTHAAPATVPSVAPTSPTPPTSPTSPTLAPSPTPPPASDEGPIIDIAILCYRGRAALERAAMLRDQIRVARSAAAPRPEVEPLVEELLDLVELALVESV
jgi:hypothetical protein